MGCGPLRCKGRRAENENGENEDAQGANENSCESTQQFSLGKRLIDFGTSEKKTSGRWRPHALDVPDVPSPRKLNNVKNSERSPIRAPITTRALRKAIRKVKAQKDGRNDLQSPTIIAGYNFESPKVNPLGSNSSIQTADEGDNFDEIGDNAGAELMKIMKAAALAKQKKKQNNNAIMEAEFRNECQSPQAAAAFGDYGDPSNTPKKSANLPNGFPLQPAKEC
mmetsp:Transcript_13808/g.24942  ORF Transcript_13808/g.24942 Transcript_13808/m.24942 type:complete len:223 (+) Transcript_13808:245-913(+)|eukprot:CAMPEP_0197515744 /NCGR_PEP_ID=MMETSP1318-20131121/781_1 /TAXON_ID=552666 /ORGANISM="Partenskyella glossopodia, Strain RCC365" /LENGTH=222 /DNA_ID=CAMNT_0043064199 /DNA_START=215 /DNA_END=883 /DNA_ORIENTATION=+